MNSTEFWPLPSCSDLNLKEENIERIDGLSEIYPGPSDKGFTWLKINC